MRDSGFSDEGKDSAGTYRQCSAGQWGASQRPRLPSQPDTCTARGRSVRRVNRRGRDGHREGITERLTPPPPRPLGTSNANHFHTCTIVMSGCLWELEGNEIKKNSTYLVSIVSNHCLVLILNTDQFLQRRLCSPINRE